MEQREPNKHYQKVVDALIKKNKQLEAIKNSSVRIACLASDCERKSKGREVLGECEKVPAKYRWAIPYDFTITVFEPNCERLNEKQLEILLLHELMHIAIEQDGNEEKYSIAPHDIEDFRAIIDKFGLDWSNG